MNVILSFCCTTVKLHWLVDTVRLNVKINQPVFHQMKIPQFHQLFFSVIDVRKLVN